MGADEAAVSWLVASGRVVRDVSRHGWTTGGTGDALSDYPATAHVLHTRTPGQRSPGIR